MSQIVQFVFQCWHWLKWCLGTLVWLAQFILDSFYQIQLLYSIQFHSATFSWTKHFSCGGAFWSFFHSFTGKGFWCGLQRKMFETDQSVHQGFGLLSVTVVLWLLQLIKFCSAKSFSCFFSFAWRLLNWCLNWRCHTCLWKCSRFLDSFRKWSLGLRPCGPF